MLAALQVIVSITTIEIISTRAALDRIGAVTAQYVVRTCTAVEHVITGVAVDGVVAVAAVDGVVDSVAVQGVIARGGGEHLALDGGHVPHRAIGELEVLHHVARCTVGVEVALYAQGVVGAVEADDQIVGLTGERHASAGDARTQQDGVSVGADRLAVVVIDRVLTRAFAEDVGVGTRTTAEGVVATATVQGVVARVTVQGVVAAFSNEHIVTVTAIQIVSGISAHQQIRPQGAGEVVFGGGGEADCPAAQLFGECAQVGGGIELGDEEVGGVPVQIFQTSFASSAEKFDEIDDAVTRARCNRTLETIF